MSSEVSYGVSHGVSHEVSHEGDRYAAGNETKKQRVFAWVFGVNP